MNCDRNCNKPKCAGRACGTPVTTVRNFAVILGDVYRAMQRGNIKPSIITALESLCKALPQRIGPQRLLIEALIAQGQLSRAEKYLGTALLTRPNHRRLVLLRCKCLVYLCDFTTAIAELHRWMPNRPWDVEAHVLAGEAAALAGQNDLAAGHFAMACAYSTERINRRKHLARAHNEAGKFDEAQQWIIDVGLPCPRLEGQLAARRGELLNASDLLHRAVLESNNSFQRQLALVELLNVRKRLGYPFAVRQAIALVQSHETFARAYAGESLVGLGAYREAASVALRTMHRARRHQLAGPTAAVASAMCRRTRSAARVLNYQQTNYPPTDAKFTSRLWRESIFNQIIAQQSKPQPTRPESQTLLLQPVLKQTLRVIDDRLRNTNTFGNGAELARLQHQRAECLIALGRPMEAMTAVRRAA